MRCSGTQPCQRCAIQSLDCAYNAEHRRGRPASPLPSLLVDISAPLTAAGQASTPKTPPPQRRRALNPANPAPSEEPVGLYEQQRQSSRSSHDPDETLYEGHYTGPTSGIAFMHRVQRRFKQDLAATITSRPNGKGTAPSSVFSFGDGHFPDRPLPELVFPSREKAKQLVDRYFDFAMPTYRFLQQHLVEEWLEIMCDENEKGLPEWRKLSNAKVAIILLVLATSALFGGDLFGDHLTQIRGGNGTDYEQR